MPDTHQLIQEQLVTKGENINPDYQRLLSAYVDNPFYDLIVRPEEKAAQTEKPAAAPVV